MPLNPDVIVKNLDKEMVLVNINTNEIFELNATGAQIWRLLEEGCSASGIVGRLVESFEVDPAQATREVSQLIERLENEGLLLP